MPRAISSAMQAAYAKGSTHFIQCWRATLTDGTIIASTTHTSDLVIGGVTYASSVGYTPSDVVNSSDLSFDNLEVDGYLASPQISAQDVESGRWDYAAIELLEVNVADLTQINILRSGTLGQVVAGRSTFKAELRGLTQAYSRRIVRLTTQTCNADLGDARCKVNLAAWTVSSAVQAASANKIVSDTARTEAADWFVGGKITFTSGLNSGLSMEVKRYTPGSIELFEAMPFAIAVGDTYTVYRGCQKRLYQDCIGAFNNGVNFRGFPHLPGVGVFGGPGTTITPATVP